MPIGVNLTSSKIDCFLFFKARKSNLKTLIDYGCCISYTDDTKKETLNSESGQSALYWIVMNTPELASINIIISMLVLN